MTYVSCDIESYSELDLTEVGVYAYAEHPSTRIHCLSYAIDAGPVQTWIAGAPMPGDLMDALLADAELRAWNANFERVMLNGAPGRRFGFPATPIEQWRCTMVLSAYNGLPKGLDDAAKAVGLREGKDKEGAKIMRLLCQPKRPTKKDPATEWSTVTHAAHFEKLYAYCAQDVEVERAIHKRLPRMPQEEIELYWLDQEINDRGILTDAPLVERVCGMIETKAEDFQRRAIAIAGVSTSQRDEILKWCASRGVYLEGYTKDDVASALKTKSLPPEVREVLEIRRDASRQSSGSKFFAAKRAACKDGRLRGMFRFFGAVPTGRWCVAEGSPVVVKTAEGEVRERPIEKVRMDDLVWDGSEWVTHGGVLYSGDQEVITWDGVTATARHLVFVSDTECITLEEAKAKGLPLFRGSTPWA